MTCIAGYADGHEMILMADSRASGDCLKFSSTEDKLIQMGPALIGVSGSYRLRQVIRYHATPPSLSPAGPHYSLVRWVETLRACLREHGLLTIKDNVEEQTAGRLLVALEGALFEIDGSWQVIAPALPYWAIGCGQGFALGALAAMETVPGSPEDRLRWALGVAARFDMHVAPPFTVLKAAVSHA